MPAGLPEPVVSMTEAFVATGLFAISIVCASRSTRALGGIKANVIRISISTLLLGLWAFTLGGGFDGPARWLFFVSGCVGYGVGDMALYLALPTLGSRLSMVLVHCLAAPFAALSEWIWLGTRLGGVELGAAALILGGVAVALAPEKGAPAHGKDLVNGIMLGVLAAVSQGIGAVLSRKAFALARAEGWNMDGGTAAFQRILGGFLITMVATWVLTRYQSNWGRAQSRDEKGLDRVWPWVLGNCLAGPILGVSFFQWALKSTASGIVLPIVATTPILVIPLARWLEGDRPSRRSLAGGVVAVVGAVWLALSR